jgi:hypothetical protein
LRALLSDIERTRSTWIAARKNSARAFGNIPYRDLLGAAAFGLRSLA